MNPRSFPEKTLLGEEHKNWKRQESGSEPGTLCVFLRVFSSMSLCERQYIALTKIGAFVIRVKQFFICKNLVFGPHFGQKSYKIVLIIRTFPFRNTLKSHVFKSYVVVRKRAPWLAIMFAKIVLHPIRNRSSAPVCHLSLFVALSLRPFN